ncbi:uncharacterized protein [Venturia canescens]|uniref:uncharacterized protein isoform X2 n=1 Tax=Venturia canescens TaxID=32260 RepID=UPI001C9D2C86|nr:uncharacterized protein LOC122407913 isoform X2 [Venturia canescens]
MEPRTANEKTYKSRKRYWQNIDAYTKLFMDTCKRLPKEADYAQYKLIPTVEDGERRRRRQRNDASSSAETRRETANDDEAEQYEQCHAVSGESSSRNSNTDDDSASSMNDEGVRSVVWIGYTRISQSNFGRTMKFVMIWKQQ